MKKLLCAILLFPMLAGAQSYNFYFDFNADVPNSRSMDDYARWKAGHPAIEVTALSGFCDTVDSEGYNRELALRRVGSVLAMLRRDSLKIADPPHIKAVGENFDASADAARNRKVEIVFRTATRGTTGLAEMETVRLDDRPLAEKFANVKVGDIIRIHNINFFLNSERITPESLPELHQLLQVMLDHPSLRIEIHGYICCNPDANDTRLSYRRAKSVFDFLRGYGVKLNRLGYRGFGSANPIYQIPEKTAAEEAANRRVEILIKAI